MGRPVNPYIAGAPLRGERGFFGRQDTLEWVERELRNPATNALVLFGQRRIGKTSLLLQLQRTLPANAFLPVYFDLHGQVTRPLGQVLAYLAKMVIQRIGLELPNTDAFDDQGHFFCDRFLPQLYQALGKDCRPVFLLDEFDVLGRVAETELPETSASKALFPFLHRVMTENSRPAFVFVIGRRSEDLNMDFTATFKASLAQEIWVLDQESAEALVRQAEANGTLCFTDQAVVRILELTSCHPFLTQLLCQRIWQQAYAGDLTAPPSVDVPEVEAAISSALETGDQALAWLWNGLNPAERIYAAALAETADEGETIARDQVIQVLTAHAARLRTREVEQLAPRDLVKRKVLEKTGEVEYRFAVELFRRWVRQNKPLQEVKDELDRVEPVANRLYEVGRGFFNRRRREIAIRYFREGLEVYPRHFRARLHLGEALLELNQTDKAVTELEQAYELDQEEARLPLARALVAQAETRERAGDEDGALAACKRALQISPSERAAQEIRTTIWTQRGDAALKRDDLKAALTAYREAGDTERITQVKALQGKELAYLFARGVGALEQQDWRQARHALAEVVRRQPHYEENGQQASRLLDEAETQLKRKVRAYIGLTGAVLVAIIGLCGALGQPVVEQWLAALSATPIRTTTPTATPTTTPIPVPTGTPAPSLSPPEAPVVDPAGEFTLSAGETIAIRASAMGAEWYKWELQGDGVIQATEGEAILYTAPEQVVEGLAVLSVTAYNNQGESPPTSLVIKIAVSQTASVRLDTVAIPAGWMSGGDNPESFISLETSPSDCHTGSDCLQVTYANGGWWGGVYWWPLSCGSSSSDEAWDRVLTGMCGANVLEIGNFSIVDRLTFWARGDRGGEVIEFKIGGADMSPSPGRSLGKVTLESTWEQYEINVEDLDMTNAIGLFVWVATDADNPQGAIFYLDDIQFEGRMYEDIQVVYLALDLATGIGQRKYPDASGVINLARDEIDGLAALSGRAILGGADTAGCYWEGKTGVADPWKPIGSADCRFRIQIPDQVTAIYLKLTVGGQIRLFTVRIQ
jgi:tetratricopeptide (TPR) repeat protein